jgi:signal transduction histidine kinase
LVAFFALVYFTEGPTSPFFVFFVFALIAATIRWRWQATLWTGLVAIVGFVALGIYAAEFLHDPAFELNRFLIRGVYLSVLVVLLSYLGHYTWRLQRELAALGAWPANFPDEESHLLRELLQKSLATLGARRAIFLWEDKSNGSCRVVTMVDGELRSLIEAQLDVASLVAAPLSVATFFCNNLGRSRPRVVYTAPDGLERWRGAPLKHELQARFGIHDRVLSSFVIGEFVEGRIFFVGKRGLSSDDLVVAEIVSQMIAARLDNWSLLNELRDTTAKEARVQLADALHADPLQSLAVTGLQMEILGQLLQKDPEGAKAMLARAQQQLLDGTRSMRNIVTQLKTVRELAPNRADSRENSNQTGDPVPVRRGRG